MSASNPTTATNEKRTFVYQTKVRFLNDVCLRQMMTATPNYVRFANDVCLTAHWGKHRIIETDRSNIILSEAKKSYRRRRCIIKIAK